MQSFKAATLVLALLLALPLRAATLLDTIDPDSIVGSIVGIGIDPATGNLVLYGEFGGATINVIDQTGADVGTITSPGVNSNDYDLDYSLGPMTIGGTPIPAGTLLVFNGDDFVETLYAVDTDGTVLAQVGLASVSLVGGAHIPGTNTVATVDFTGEDFIRILSADDGSEQGSFNPGPPPFDIFYGDLDLAESTGEITVVSDAQNIVRQLTQQGFCVRELDVSPFGISGMTGVAIDDATGNLWISSRNGSVYHFDPRPDLGDSDGDGLLDFNDNCVNAANADQRDTDGDGIGNICDADLTNDCETNFGDLAAFKQAFFPAPYNADADFNGDGFVNFGDLARMKELFLEPPGLSGRGNLCGCGL